LNLVAAVGLELRRLFDLTFALALGFLVSLFLTDTLARGTGDGRHLRR